MSGSAFAVTHHAFSSGAGRTSDGNGSHASTLKSPSYTKSVSWQHYRFKLLIKPGCDSTEEEGDAWYLRPGDVVHQPELRQPGNHYLVYNDKFIKISDSCPAKPPSAD